MLIRLRGIFSSPYGYTGDMAAVQAGDGYVGFSFLAYSDAAVGSLFQVSFAAFADSALEVGGDLLPVSH